ncbi:MAG TPA: MerR family transcriptional regulator [Myxococcaceae bacterium]|nr:MerR family transcriptional regulator [Myxococcaceae bacterium]
MVGTTIHRRRRRWRIGELAQATGLTVRTLHHYEHIGLLAPATRSEGRHRLYDERDVQRLYRVRALRELGLSLAEIARTLEDGGARLGDVLRAHLARVDSELQRLARLRERLERVSAHTAARARTDDLLAMIEAMTRLENHVDAVRASGSARDDTEARWRKLGAQLRAQLDKGESPSAPAVLAVARRARAGLHEFAGGDPAVLAALARVRRGAPEIQLAGWDSKLLQYLDRALAALDDTEEDAC